MADPLYTKLLATAQRLLDQYGKDAKLVRTAVTGGPAHNPTTTTSELDIKLVETGYSITNREGTLVVDGSKIGIISTTGGNVPQMDDRIKIDGEEYSFVDKGIQPLNPGGIVLLYEFEAE